MHIDLFWVEVLLTCLFCCVSPVNEGHEVSELIPGAFGCVGKWPSFLRKLPRLSWMLSIQLDGNAKLISRRPDLG